ncbi:unnamed protein product [Orchesella dallaii]|uniref:Uncharacterized protein n=1 Tax=Orchesella dallaii TaxID=48710 RepID=A0ABP1QEF5_9HEXA
MKTENGDGVVNQGFSEDCPAESELDGLDVDINPAKGYHTSPTVDESTINIQSPSANRTQQTIHHDSFSSQPVMGIIPDKGQSSFCLDNTQAAPVNHITDKNDYEKMHETSALATTEVPSIPNGFPPNNCHESETADPIENKVKNDVVTNGAYFRDVRLSLDTSKIASGDQLYKESYCIESSYNGSTTSDTSDSCIDTCESKINNHYKLVFKYVVERPLFCFSVWAMLYIFWGTSALPGGSLYALTILEITALCLGYLAELMELPGLLGMLAAGLILRNVPYIDVATYLDSSVSTPFRGVSIVILLIRGALGVNTTNIVKFKNIVPPLVIGSCLLEAIAASVAVYLIIGFPIEWASLMGCIMSAMSGVAVLPYLATTEKYLSLKADPCSLSPNYKDVIVIARTACGLDAMIAITMAEVALGFVFGEGIKVYHDIWLQ